MEAVLGYLFIYCARTVDVSLAVFRTILVVRGKRLLAATIGFFEVSIFVLALGRVMTNFDDPLNVLFYALGFATGNFVGSTIEEKVALGYVTVQIVAKSNGKSLGEHLRSHGFGVTIVEGHGRSGPRAVLYATLKRRNLEQFMKIVDERAGETFVTILDTRKTQGGFFADVAKKS